MIEKKIPGSEYFAPLIYSTYNIYQDLVQLENQGDLGKITEINANVVTWPCVSTQGANAHELIDWITEHLSDPPMDLIWCPDKPHGSNAPDMFTASLLYATWQVGTPPVLGHAQSLCPLVLLESAHLSAPLCCSTKTDVDTQISNDMLGKSKPNPKIINMTTIRRPFTMTDALKRKFPTFGNNQKNSTKMRSIFNCPRNNDGQKVATLKPVGTQKIYHSVHCNYLPSLSYYFCQTA